MMEVVSDIKLEIEEDGDQQENMTSLNNNTELDIEDKEAPLALVKRRPERDMRDITERFPYIDEVTTTTPSRSAPSTENQRDSCPVNFSPGLSIHFWLRQEHKES